LEDLDDKVEINSYWETSSGEIKLLAEGRLDYEEFKEHQKWFL
jgi:hypothetical protein